MVYARARDWRCCGMVYMCKRMVLAFRHCCCCCWGRKKYLMYVGEYMVNFLYYFVVQNANYWIIFDRNSKRRIMSCVVYIVITPQLKWKVKTTTKAQPRITCIDYYDDWIQWCLEATLRPPKPNDIDRTSTTTTTHTQDEEQKQIEKQMKFFAICEPRMRQIVRKFDRLRSPFPFFCGCCCCSLLLYQSNEFPTHGGAHEYCYDWKCRCNEQHFAILFHFLDVFSPRKWSFLCIVRCEVN